MSEKARVSIAWCLVAVALGLPLFLSINYIARFAVDVPYWDQWELVAGFEKWDAGTYTLADAWRLHNEHRILFPRFIFLALASFSRWDTRWEIWFNWLILVGLFAVLVAEHLRAFGRSLVAVASVVPVAWLVFTLRQDTNLLWGFQIQITLCALAACAALWMLDAPGPVTPQRFAAALLCAFVGSFSFGSGLMVWPAGLALLAVRWSSAEPAARKALALWAGLWAGLAAISAVLYFHGYAREVGAAPPVSQVLAEPGKALYYFLIAIGGPLGSEADPSACAAAGAVLLALALAFGAAAVRDQLDLKRSAFGVGLVSYVAATVATITVGRLAHAAGASSRYTTLTLLGIVGLFRIARVLKADAVRYSAIATLSGIVVVGLFVTLDTEYVIGARTLRERQKMREVLLDWRNRPDGELVLLYPVAATVKERAPILEKLGYSVFRRTGAESAQVR